MRVYLNGRITTPQETFLPSDLWFATKDADDTDVVSDKCVCLSGCEVESILEGTEFSTRWKGVMFSYIDEDGEEVTEELNSYEDFIKFINENKMALANISAYLDADTDVKIDEIEFNDGEMFVLDSKLIEKTIEFIV